MARQKPELYDIRMNTSELTKEFLHALTEGLLLTLKDLGIWEALS